MDFTQHNKINSFYPGQNRLDCCSKRFQNPNFPSFSQPMQQQHQQSIMHPFHQDIQIHSKSFDPYMFNTSADICGASTIQQHQSFCGDSQYIQQQQHQLTEPAQEETINEPNADIDIEYFQCTPPNLQHQRRRKAVPANPYKPIIESMRQFKFNQNCTKNFNIKSHGTGDVNPNHQTYFYKHNDDNNDNDDNKALEECNSDEEIINNHKCYRSHTKIISIPNGVKIITEIKKEDNDDIIGDNNSCNECEEQSNLSINHHRQCMQKQQQQQHDKWHNKKIEIVVGDNGNKDNDDGEDDKCDDNDEK